MDLNELKKEHYALSLRIARFKLHITNPNFIETCSREDIITLTDNLNKMLSKKKALDELIKLYKNKII